MRNGHYRSATIRRLLLTGTTAGALVAAAAVLPVAPSAFAQEEAAQQMAMDASQIIQDWPNVSQKAANAMIEKYGQPDEMTDTLLIWRDNGPFVRTIVYGYEIDHNFPKPHKDVLEQFIRYDVPEDMFDELAMFDGSVIAERTKGELSGRCDSEHANLISLNLADDIIKGEKSVEEARQAYGEAIKAVMTGNPPEIAQELTFDTPDSNVNNPDEAIIETAQMDQPAEQAGEAMQDQAMEGEMQAMVDASGTTSEGNTITVPSVTLPQSGFVVVHAMLDGQPVVPASIGHTAVEAGTTENVSVDLSYAPESGESYMVMLHADTNNNGEYEFGEGSTDVDTPVMMNGEIVIESFTAQ